jgi:hypothetical protein
MDTDIIMKNTHMQTQPTKLLIKYKTTYKVQNYKSYIDSNYTGINLLWKLNLDSNKDYYV